MTYRRTALFALLAVFGFDTDPLFAETAANASADKRRRQSLSPSIRTTSPAFGRTPEDSIPS